MPCVSFLKAVNVLMTGSADQAWPLVLQDLQFFIDNGSGKKMYFDEVSHARVPYVSPATYVFTSKNGWPSVTSPSVQPNSPDAVADVPNEAVSPSLS